MILRSVFPKNKRQKAYKAGLWAESLAAYYLRFCGYRILERRYKTPVGEIDLVVRKGNVIAAVEVKARDNVALGIEAVHPRNRLRVERAASYFIGGFPEYAVCAVRFDIVAVALAYGFWPVRFRHLPRAWDARD